MAIATSLNPFFDSGDLRRYLPRPACEAALAAIEGALRAGALAMLLAGPPGIGKSMLLRALAHRLRRDFRVALLPAVGLEAHEICAWALALLRAERGEDPECELAMRAADWKRRGSALVVLIDDAHQLSLDAASRLAGLALAADGGLRWVATTREPCDALRKAFGHEAEAISLRAGMSFGETAEYVRAALAAASAEPEVRAFFDGAMLVQLHRDSGGVPGEVNRLAAERLGQAVRGGTLPPPGRTTWRTYAARLTPKGPAVVRWTPTSAALRPPSR
jgi:DamX protein